MKGKKQKAAPAAPTAEREPEAFYIRNNEALREARAGERLRALAKRAGATETHVARALLALGLRQAEADLGALSRAFIPG